MPPERTPPRISGESGAWRRTAAAQSSGLLAEIRARDADHFDQLSVTALLESAGLRDADVRRRYGAEDAFALGSELISSVPAPGTRQRRAELPAAPGRATPGAVRHGLIAASFLAPVALQIAAFLTFGFSLWASSRFSPAQATTVALATLLSLTATAPATQAIARRGAYYRNAGNAALLRAELRRLGVFGALAALAVGSVTLLIWPTLVPAVSARGDFAGYFGLLAVLWLAVAQSEARGLRPALALATAVGLGVVWTLRHIGAGDLVVDQWLGLAAMNGLLLAAGELHTARQGRRLPPALAGVRLLPPSALLAKLWPLLVYGLLYYLFIFADRLLAWAAGPLTAGRSLSFRGDYEAGLDCALLTLFAGTTVIEIALERFAGRLIPAAAATSGGNTRDLGRSLLGLLARQALALLLTGAATLAAGAALLQFLGGAAGAFDGPVVREVYLTGSAAYLVFALGLLASAGLQTLACQAAVLPGLGVALLTNLTVGGFATRVAGYQWATLGLLAGAVVFAVYTWLRLRVALRDAAYLLSRALA